MEGEGDIIIRLRTAVVQEHIAHGGVVCKKSGPQNGDGEEEGRKR